MKWSRVCRSKKKGGLGVKNLHKQNIALLTKWWWKLDTGEGLWQDIVRNKYLKKSSVACVKQKFSDSPAWKNLLKIKDYYMAGRSVIIKSGDVARIWHDPIAGQPPLKVTYPELFSISNFPDDTIAQFRDRGLEGVFRRRLSGPLATQFGGFVKMIEETHFPDEKDKIEWAYGPKGRYTTKSMYEYLERNISGCDYRWIWKAKLPVKIQIFLWQLFQDAVLTRDVMKRKNWAGNPKCSFCSCRETYLHLFFLCPVARVAWRTVGSMLGTDLCPNNLCQFYSWCYAFFPEGECFYTTGLAAICWAIWNCRNQATFEFKKLTSPFEIVFAASVHLSYWAGLLKGVDRTNLEHGAELLKENAKSMMRICATAHSDDVL